MSSTTAPSKLASKTEVILKRRRRIQGKSSLLTRKRITNRSRKQKGEKGQKKKKNRFIRAESLVAKSLASERESERVKRIVALERRKAKVGGDSGESVQALHLPSDRDFILKITERRKPVDEEGGDDADVDIDDDDDEDSEPFIKEKIVYDGKPTLLFVIRLKGPAEAKIPGEAARVLSVLRLQRINTGVFLKLTKTVYPLLKIVSPYIVVGQPSLSSIRSLIQKRGKIMYRKPNSKVENEIALNDNNIVEEKLGDEGIICIEDIVHEISTMGPSFKAVSFFLRPFQLHREVSGFSALNKLRKLILRESEAKYRRNTNSPLAPIIQVDIDDLISRLN